MKKKNMLILGIGAALATAAAVFFVRKKKFSQDEKPPKKAPQVPIDNPGDQSEFTTTAIESEIG
ncbi:MAG: LPXTG cell wall anchor domain-containing protein [Flavisolibacter sp.]